MHTVLRLFVLHVTLRLETICCAVVQILTQTFEHAQALTRFLIVAGTNEEKRQLLRLDLR